MSAQIINVNWIPVFTAMTFVGGDNGAIFSDVTSTRVGVIFPPRVRERGSDTCLTLAGSGTNRGHP